MNTTKKKNSNHSKHLEGLIDVIAREQEKQDKRLIRAEEDLKVAKKILDKILKKHGI